MRKLILLIVVVVLFATPMAIVQDVHAWSDSCQEWFRNPYSWTAQRGCLLSIMNDLFGNGWEGDGDTITGHD